MPLIWILLLGLSLTAVGFGQVSANSQPYRVQVYVDLVQIPTLVLTSLHKSYPGLSPESFSVTVDGQPFPHPEHVRLEGDDPVAFAVLLDVDQKEQLEIAHRFSDSSEPGPSKVFTGSDHVSVFADDCTLVRSIQEVPASLPELRTGVLAALASPTLHGSPGDKPRCGAERKLWNVIATTILQLQKLPGRRVLLVISDGVDEESTTSSEAVRRLAVRSGVTIFALKPEPPAAATVHGMQSRFYSDTGDDLAALCAGTGGLTFYDESETLGSTVAKTMGILRKRYILDFERPRNTTDGEHRIDVRIPDTAAIIRVSGTIFPARERHSIDSPKTLPPDPSPTSLATTEDSEPFVPATGLPSPPTVPLIRTISAQAAIQPAQQQPTPTLHVTSRLVYVDVVAHDKHGKASSGLNQDDFQVSERLPKRQDQPQKIALFEEMDFTGDHPLPAPRLQQVSDPHVAHSQEDPPPPTILLIDALNTNLHGQRDVIRKLTAMIDAIPPRSSAALLIMGGQLAVLQNFTLDHALLKQAAARAFSPKAISFSSLVGQNLNADPNSPYVDQDFAAFIAKTTSSAFKQIAQQMSAVPGRKNLIWVSDSFPSSAPAMGHEPAKSFYSSDIQPAMDALSAARVAVYSVAVSGPEPPHLGVENNASLPGPTPPLAVSDFAQTIVSDELMRNMRQSTMQVISEKTGGIACTDVYDLPGCVAKALDNGSHYYEIAYYPTSHAPGTHDVIVRSKLPGVTLTYSQSYESQPSKPQP